MLTRRKALTSALAVSGTIALAACTPEVSNLTDPTPSQEASVPSEPIEVCLTGDIPVGSGKRFTVLETPILITQPRAGEFRAFSAVCTHAGFVMSAVADSTITCDNHGAQYSAEDGSVTKGPAPRALGKISLTVEGDKILVNI